MSQVSANTAGAGFLHERDPNLHHSREVEGVVRYLRQNGEAILLHDKAGKIDAYLGFLASEDLVNDGLLTGDKDSSARQIGSLVISPDEIPKNYFDLQRRIAREQGQGNLDITPDVRGRMTESVQQDQAKSLQRWVNYLTDGGNPYPNWFKKYAFDGVTSLGIYDKQKKKFTTRSKETVAPFADLNAEALGYVYDSLNRYRIKSNNTPANEQLATLIQGGNFGRLYAYAIEKVTPASQELRNITEGSWVLYEQIEGDYDPEYQLENGQYVDHSAEIDDPTALALSDALQGHGTGWCTAGVSTAAHQLSMGDFYVYYTNDEKGAATTPRIAVRMEDGLVAEVRGITENQNLESSMVDITLKKIVDLPGGDKYFEIAANLKRLTDIDNRVQAGGQLSPEDLYFLYVDTIVSFGYEDDPRVNELLLGREIQDDLILLSDAYSVDAIADALIQNGKIETVLHMQQSTSVQKKAWAALTNNNKDFLDHGKLIASSLRRFNEIDLTAYREYILNLERPQVKQVDELVQNIDILLPGVQERAECFLNLFKQSYELAQKRLGNFLTGVDQREFFDIVLPDIKKNRGYNMFRYGLILGNAKIIEAGIVDFKEVIAEVYTLYTRLEEPGVQPNFNAEDTLVCYLDQLDPSVLDHTSVARAILDNPSKNGLSRLIHYLEDFAPGSLDHNELVDVLVRHNKAYQLAFGSDKFIGLTPDRRALVDEHKRAYNKER